jgi:pteridine reductase
MTNKGKQAIITGGAIRVGRAISEALAKMGFETLIIYNNSSDEAEELRDYINSKLNKKCQIFQCDVSKIENIDDLCRELFNKYDNISLLVNNASIFERFNFRETNEDIFDRHFDINFKAPFFLTQKFADYVEKNKIEDGSVINILDTYITTTENAYFAYLLSKKGLYEFTRMTAKELAPKIRVNSISLGQVLASKDWSEEQVRKKEESLPLKKRATLKDVADAIEYMVNANYLTGNNLFLDGGQNVT